jgi:hypothetical protein
MAGTGYRSNEKCMISDTSDGVLVPMGVIQEIGDYAPASLSIKLCKLEKEGKIPARERDGHRKLVRVTIDVLPLLVKGRNRFS